MSSELRRRHHVIANRHCLGISRPRHHERLPIAEYTVSEVLAMAKASGSLGDGLAGPVSVTLGFRYPAPGAHEYDRRMPLQDPTDATGQPGTRIPHIALTGAITSTLDSVDPCGFILLAPEISCYAVQLARTEALHPQL